MMKGIDFCVNGCFEDYDFGSFKVGCSKLLNFFEGYDVPRLYTNLGNGTGGVFYDSFSPVSRYSRLKVSNLKIALKKMDQCYGKGVYDLSKGGTRVEVFFWDLGKKINSKIFGVHFLDAYFRCGEYDCGVSFVVDGVGKYSVEEFGYSILSFEKMIRK